MNKLLLLGEIMTTIKTFPVGQQHSYPKVDIRKIFRKHRSVLDSDEQV
jgi:hypothetical protein